MPAHSWVPCLGSMLGIARDVEQIDRPLTASQWPLHTPAPATPAPRAPSRSPREGWTIRDILAHGVIDYQPTLVGPASLTADMQEWFEADAADGFWVSIDVCEDGIDTSVDEVVLILQDRGLYHLDYEGPTLRNNLKAPESRHRHSEPRTTGPLPL